MDLEERVNSAEKVNSVDPHHKMLAGAGATIGYMSYLLLPMYLINPFVAVIAGGLLGYLAAKSVKD